MGAHRERMREQGFRLVQVWVPDVRSEEFASAAHRQSVIVGTADRESEDLAFVEAVSAPWNDGDGNDPNGND